MILAVRIDLLVLLACVCETSVSAFFGQEQIPVSRIQKRVLHQLAQKAELNVGTVLTDELPTPEKSDSFHPATKSLGS